MFEYFILETTGYKRYNQTNTVARLKQGMQVSRAAGRANLRSIFTTLFFLTMLSYFSYHIVSGDRGLLAYIQLKNKVEHSRMELDAIRADRLTLEHQVELLSTKTLDLDMLDEQARKVLGYAAEDEMVFTLDNDNNS